MLLAAGPAAAVETLVGRWCDPEPPGGVVEIVNTGDHGFEARLGSADGSIVVRPLHGPYEFSFPVIGSAGDDRYEIDPSTGDLGIFFESSPVRIAVRLSDTPVPGDCPKDE